MLQHSTEQIPSWASAWLNSRDDPYLFVTEVLHQSPEAWQSETLKALRDGEKALSIRSGHGVGKTTLLAWLVIWGITCHQDCKIPVAANSQDQLRDTVWPEIAKQVKNLPEEMQSEIIVDTKRVYMSADPDGSFAVARTCSKENSEALAGFHAGFLMFLIDEASGIPDIVFEVATGALSTPGAIQVMTGNPTQNSGYFHASHHQHREGWHTQRVNSEDVPRATGHIKKIISEFGRDSNQYRVRVLGEFPLHDDDVLVSLDCVQSAVNRDVKAMDVSPVWGVDPARFGSDRSTLCKRRGNVIMEPIQVFRQRDTMTLAGIIAAQYEEADLADQPHEICVDVIGIGAGVVDRLDELGLPVRGVNVAEAPSVSGTYLRLRDELWFKVKQFFEARDCKMPQDDALIAELVTPKYQFTSAGKLQVESKDAMKKRGLRSPDLADALMLTFAADDRRRAALARDRHRRGTGQRRSGWSA